jgi:hypothetical protein
VGKRKIKWLPGDNFLIPLIDGTYGQGQVLVHEAHAMNSVVCAFFSAHYQQSTDQLNPTSEESLLAVLYVTRDLLDVGRWHVVNNGSIVVPWEKFLDIRAIRAKRHVGVVIHGSGIVADFLNAYHKLILWNHYYDPEYFDKLLISLDRKPTNLLLK